MVNSWILFSKSLLLAFICFFMTDSFIYWKKIPYDEQIELLQSNRICKDAYDLYKGNFKVCDNTRTEILLDSLSLLSTDIKIKALYFYLFNQICLEADGALSEMLGRYCQKVILSDIEYILYYLKNNRGIFIKYSQLLGHEFYFKENGTSDMQYNFRDFKRIINNKLGCKKEYDLFLSDFYKNIQCIMHEME